MHPAELWKKVKSYLFTGALVMVPLFITVYILVGIIRWVGRLAGVGHGPASSVVGIILMLGLILAAGAMTQHTIGTRYTGWIARIMTRIPIAGSIYSAIKQIMEAFMLRKSMAFQKAVLIEYPRRGIYSVAFVTREHHQSPFIPGDEEAIHVFMPTTPNPTSGFFLIIPAKEIIPMDISVQEAFRLIISGGIASYETPHNIQEEIHE